MGGLPGRQDFARARRARSRAAVARQDPECRADRCRLFPRPSRLALRRRLAREPSEAGCLARPFSRASAGLRGNKSRRIAISAFATLGRIFGAATRRPITLLAVAGGLLR